MADKKYTKLPGVHQTPVIKNFFESTVEQLFSKANIDQISAFIGRRDQDVFEIDDRYIIEPTVDRDKYSLELTVNSREKVTGKSINTVYWEDFLNILKSYGVDTYNQNAIFDTPFYSFIPPIDIDKFINYQEYFWSPVGPTAITISGTEDKPINIEKDILGKKTYTSPSGVKFKNGMIITFSGNEVIPGNYIDERFIVEGVGTHIKLFNKDQNYATTFSTEDFIPFDQTIIDETDTLVATSKYSSGGLIGVENYEYYSEDGQFFTYVSELDVDADNGGEMWTGYVTAAGNSLVYTVGGEGAFDIEPFDSGNTQEVPDYITMQRASKDNNVWSRINFWHHRDNFIDAGDDLPGKEFRAMRPIIEFDRDIELFNFGKESTDPVDIAAFDVRITEVNGRPNGAVVDSSTLSVGTTLIFPNESPEIAPYKYEVQEKTEAEIITDTYAVSATVTNSSTTQVQLDTISGITPNSIVTSNIVDQSTTLHEAKIVDIYSGNSTVEFSEPFAVTTGDTFTIHPATTIHTLASENTDIYEGAKITSETQTLADITVESISGTTLTTNTAVAIIQHSIVDFSERVILKRLPAENNPTNAVDGDSNFIPYIPKDRDITSVRFGSKKQGIEYYWDSVKDKWIEGQSKYKVNTPIRFSGYNADKVSLDDNLTYEGSNFAGNKIFSYTTEGPNTTNDPVLGFPLQYVNFNNFSEISYTNDLDSQLVSYLPMGSTDRKYIDGYIYYKKTLENGDIVFNTMWRPVEKQSNQKVENRHIVTEADTSADRIYYSISAVPTNAEESIRVYINGKRNREFSYDAQTMSVKFIDVDLKENDIIDIYTETETGYIEDENTDGRFNVPLSWHSNLDKKDIKTISQPQYLEHFKNLIEHQENVTGDPLGKNNFRDLPKDIYWAQKIVQTDEDSQTAAFLFSNDDFNLKDAMSFCAEEYVKYKNRLQKEIDKFVNTTDTEGLSYGTCLEFVLDATIAFNQGKNVFNDTYMVAHGDKKIEEKIVINNVLRKEYVLDHYVDLNDITNTIYVYMESEDTETLLTVDKDYTINSDNSMVTITFADDYVLTLGNQLCVEIFSTDRESTQVPPTPSAMGLYPVYEPKIINDTTFRSPIKVILGHDGSRTVAKNDIHDYILLEFERRIYNGIKQAYRDTDSYPDLNVLTIRPGYFRNTKRSRDRFYALLRSNFNLYVARNDIDFVKNEFFDEEDPWTWNYNSDNADPSYWRGIYEHLYDTESPNTTPWEMLGFSKKPVWWSEEYGVDFSSENTKLWKDLEAGIIRQGSRENVTNKRYLDNNLYSRPGLKDMLPVNTSGDLLPPKEILSTTASQKTTTWSSTITGTPSSVSNSFIDVNGLNVQERSGSLNVIAPNNVNHAIGKFPSENNQNEILDATLSYTIELNGNTAQSLSYANAQSTNTGAVGFAVNGALIRNANTGEEYSQSSAWHYDAMYRNYTDRDEAGGSPDNNGTYGYVQPSPQVLDLNEWDNSTHSPIVGWAFDGCPIYGPYGYTDRLNANSAIKRLETSYRIISSRTGISGNPTGEFVEDYEYSSGHGDLDQFNGRYGITPEFPNGVYYYVATIDANSKPQYPYTVGPKFAFLPTDLERNILGTAEWSTAGTEVYRLTSEKGYTYTNQTSLANKGWKFGDGAPAENAWKMSSNYPFAVAEALLLAKPGKFVSVFAEPDRIIRKSAEPKQLLDKTTNRRFKVQSSKIHGSKNTDGKLITSTGFTQFIDPFLKFKGLNTPENFSDAFKSIHSKLGHKFAGYVDKDTMTVYTDSFSTTGNSSSLILPAEDIQINLHVGPYSSTNDYTGVIITLTEDNTYKISGYNNLKRFFEIEDSDKNGPRTEVSVGGEPAEYTNYDQTERYSASTIIKSGYNYYRAKISAAPGSLVTDTTIWERLPGLPTVGGAEATYYMRGTGKTSKVEYDTEYDNVADLYDFLISLGRKQKSLGFDFGEFNNEINDLNDWAYSGKQFLFWSLGKWSPGNTLSLSPLADKATFKAPIGRVGPILDADQGQYSIVDEEGNLIRPEECEIIREDNFVSVSAINKQIFGIILYTNEIEHSMLVSNKTSFGDTIFDDMFNQRQLRLKVKGKRTAGWNGTLTSEGYLITDDSLLPNFDTLANDMRRYAEIGHVPVNKELYDLTRRQYGYNERSYLNEFELTFDDQYDFYAGMIRSKGTKNSLEVLLNSDKVFIPGEVDIYDEWALKVEDFGDVDNYQSLDLKIDKAEITNEKQLISIAYPEDAVSKVKEVEVLDRTTKFFAKPFLEIEPPPAEIPGSFTYGGGTTAKAEVNIASDGRISNVVITEPGYGYTINPSVTVVAAQLLTANITTAFLQPWAVSTSYVANSAVFTGANALSNVYITDHFANSTYANTVVDLSTATDISDVITAFEDAISSITLDSANLDVTGTSNITVKSTRVATDAGEEFLITFKGNDFSLIDNGSNTLANILYLEEKRYQPRQRYSFETANSTLYTDVVVKVDNTTLTGNVVGATGDHDWEFDHGSRTTFTNTQGTKTSGNVSFTFTPRDPDNNLTDAISSESLTIINSAYPHIDVLINGEKLPENQEEALFTITSNVSANTSTITFNDVSALPNKRIAAGDTITVVESSTIDFVDAYQGDLPGSALNIKVFANDALAAKLQKIRTYEIFPDNKTDATILIDVDDANRLVIRPTDMAEKNLWPTTANVDYSGITDKKYQPLPNSGYVSKYNVDYQAWNIYDFENLFSLDRRPSEIPDTNDTTHFAFGEHGDFEVYNMKNLSGNAYIKNSDTGKTFLYTDFSLVFDAGILDQNNLSNVSPDYNHRKWFDSVLVLKGKNQIDNYHGSLVHEDGELVYSPRIMDNISTPVATFHNERLINEEGVILSNIKYTVPKVRLISSIEPEESSLISNVSGITTGIAVNVPAEANVVSKTSNFSILRSADIKATGLALYNNQLVFQMSGGQLADIKVNDYIHFSSAQSTNIEGNTFRVANIVNGSIVQLYANTATLSGVPDTINRANVSFINYRDSKDGNSGVDYHVQVYAKDHGYSAGDTVKFSQDNLGAAANTLFTIESATTNTFILNSVDYGANTGLNVITNSGNIVSGNSTVTITIESNAENDTRNQQIYKAGNYISFVDTSGSILNNNTFKIESVEDKILTTSKRTDLSEFSNSTVAVVDIVTSASNGNIYLNEGNSANISAGMYAWLPDQNIDYPLLVKEVKYLNDVFASRSMYVQSYVDILNGDDSANLTIEQYQELTRATTGNTFVLNKSLPSSIVVGDPVYVSGQVDFTDGVTITNINGTTITVSEDVEIFHGTPLQFKHEYPTSTISHVVLDDDQLSFTPSSGELIEFVEGEYTTSVDLSGDAPTITTVLKIDATGLSGNVSSDNLTLVPLNGIRAEIDDSSNLYIGQIVQINNAGVYTGLQVIEDIPDSTHIDINVPYRKESVYTMTVQDATTNATVLLSEINKNIDVGMLVSSTDGTVPAGTRIEAVFASGLLKLTSNVTFSANDSVAFTDDFLRYASVVSDNLVITTNGDHEYKTDNSGIENTGVQILEKDIRVYQFNSNYYNWNWKVRSVPSNTTIVVAGYAQDHPYTASDGNTYISQKEYDLLGNTATQTSGSVANVNAYLYNSEESNITINGATIFTDIYPMLSVDDYANQLKFERARKEGAKTHVGSLGITFPYLDGVDWQSADSITKAAAAAGAAAGGIPFDPYTNTGGQYGSPPAPTSTSSGGSSGSNNYSSSPTNPDNVLSMLTSAQGQVGAPQDPTVCPPPTDPTEGMSPMEKIYYELPFMTPEEQMAAIGALSSTQQQFMVDNILPNQIIQTMPQAGYALAAQGTSVNGGYSLGGGVYDPNTQQITYGAGPSNSGTFSNIINNFWNGVDGFKPYSTKDAIGQMFAGWTLTLMDPNNPAGAQMVKDATEQFYEENDISRRTSSSLLGLMNRKTLIANKQGSTSGTTALSAFGLYQAMAKAGDGTGISISHGTVPCERYECNAGFTYNSTSGQCEKEDTVGPGDCKANEVWNETLQQCVPIPTDPNVVYHTFYAGTSNKAEIPSVAGQTDTYRFHFTTNTTTKATYPIKLYFNMFSGADKITVYQGDNQGARHIIAGTKYNTPRDMTGGDDTGDTNNEKYKFVQLRIALNQTWDTGINDKWNSSDWTWFNDTATPDTTTNPPEVNGSGFVKQAGVIEFTYDPTNNNNDPVVPKYPYIDVVIEKRPYSHQYEFAFEAPTDEGAQFVLSKPGSPILIDVGGSYPSYSDKWGAYMTTKTRDYATGGMRPTMQGNPIIKSIIQAPAENSPSNKDNGGVVLSQPTAYWGTWQGIGGTPPEDYTEGSGSNALEYVEVDMLGQTRLIEPDPSGIIATNAYGVSDPNGSHHYGSTDVFESNGIPRAPIVTVPTVAETVKTGGPYKQADTSEKAEGNLIALAQEVTVNTEDVILTDTVIVPDSPPVITVSTYEKDSNGQMQKTTETPICIKAPNPTVKICPDSDVGWLNTGASTGAEFQVGQYDSFVVDGVTVNLSNMGTPNPQGIADAINAAMAKAGVDIEAYTYKCGGAGQVGVYITKMQSGSSLTPLVLSEGCAEGRLKEVLDYQVKNFEDASYSESTVLAGSSTSSSVQTLNLPPMEMSTGDPNVSIAPGQLGTNTTSASGTNYIYNTTTAEQRKAAGNPSTLGQYNGIGYRKYEYLKVVGGTPATYRQWLQAAGRAHAAGTFEKDGTDTGVPYTYFTKIACIQIVRPGKGYKKAGLKIEISGNYTRKAVIDFDYVNVDANGGIVCGNGGFPDSASGLILSTDGRYNGATDLIPVEFAPNDNGVGVAYNEGYSVDERPQVSIVGEGTGAEARILFYHEINDNTAYAAMSQDHRVAVFQVVDVDVHGGITELVLINPGCYIDFPNDLDSGVPLAYHKGETKTYNGYTNVGQGTLDFSPAATTSGGPVNTNTGNVGNGRGGRVFLTSRILPDCANKGTTLQRMGVNSGAYTAEDPGEHLVTLLNDHAPLGPDGFPLWTASFNPSGPGGKSISIKGDNIDGIEFSDEGSPGLLAALNLPKGVIPNFTIPEIEVVDGDNNTDLGDDATGGGNDLQATNKSIRFSVPRGAETIPGNNRTYGRPDINSFNGPTFADTNIEGSIYEYELRELDLTTPIAFGGTNRTRVDLHALENMRYATESNLDLANISHAWIDNYNDTGKWAYLESNTVVRQQENLVDTALIYDVFTYDEDSAEKEYDINLYDPFKGILPGFIGKEIDFKLEHDPVVYSQARSKWGKTQVGRRWWDTSKVRYTWYEQGTGVYGESGFNNTERTQAWAEMFPGSSIKIYEWTESLVPPGQYTGSGTPIESGEFIEERYFNRKVGKTQSHYYFWVGNKSEIDMNAKASLGKERSVVELETLLTNMDAQQVLYAGYISPDSLLVNNLGSIIKTEDSIVSTKFHRRPVRDTEKHSAWILSSQGNPNSSTPDNLSIKLIDSLAGYNALGEVVPAEGLSNFERYGSKFRPRQTMFKDLQKARKQMHNVMNKIFRDLQMNTTFIDWRDNLPSNLNYLRTTNWYEKLRTDARDNSTVYYDETYKPLRKVTDVGKFGLIKNITDKTVIQVQKNANEKYSLYEYNKKSDTFKLIAKQDEIVQWHTSVYTATQGTDIGTEIREVLLMFYQDVFVDTYKEYWNEFFFEMLKHAYSEQGELDWAFKTTYLNIIKQETDLIPIKGFKVDNFNKAVDYFNEVKPYSSKIRNYRDIKQAPPEILSGNTSDFDRPPYYDETLKEVRILNNADSTDINILNSNKEYSSYVSNSSLARNITTQIVFDRVKGTLYENATAGVTEIITGDGVSNGFSFNINVQDESRLQVKVDGKLVTETGYSNGTLVTNYIVNTTDGFITFTNDANVNNRVGIPPSGAKIELRYFDGFDPTLETVNVSIARNIVNIESNSNANIADVTSYWTAPERLYKFDPDVRSAVTEAFESAHGPGAASNTSIVQNVSIVTNMVESGNLNTVLSLINTKVGAGLKGKIVDGANFSDLIPGQHPSYYYTDAMGFDSYEWDRDVFDKDVTVENFVGIFDEDTQGNVNYRVDDETVYGFDGVTFLRSRLGPDRPEELAVVEPLETLIIDVSTRGNSEISFTSSDVRYIMFHDVFGKTDYYRRSFEALTTITANVEVWEDEISVDDASRLPEASEADQGVVWINGERITYEVRDTVNNKLKKITRGTRGTSINPVLIAGKGIFNGEETENIRLRDGAGRIIRDPEDFNWIKPVEIYSADVEFDSDWDGTGAYSNAGLTWDITPGGGLDPTWDGAGEYSIEFTNSGHTLTYDVDDRDGWDSGVEDIKKARSLTDKGTVLRANTSIIDFLHNFDE